ncbi:MAG TPA: 1-deoxy-D-xylulose-5-phosphate synthase [Blastocatellia bacterium]|nr:1-deoxy-D-xylulose-5-phosphate synthase [Blastocatellia bacterium]
MSRERRLMYIEFKGDNIVGPARIGWATFSKSGKSIYYDGRRFEKISGFKSNYWDAGTHEEYWISGCKRDGSDALYSTTVEIDVDAREEYWVNIRNLPKNKTQRSFKCVGKYSK